MKTKDKKNCPRLANAIKRACIYARDQYGCWMAYYSDNLGDLIFQIAYAADKYDVLNALCPGVSRSITTYARGDIRHWCRRGCYTLVMLILVLVVFIVIKQKEPC